jgi:ABC-type branched-subunit amino acid transport system permease subunit
VQSAQAGLSLVRARRRRELCARRRSCSTVPGDARFMMAVALLMLLALWLLLTRTRIGLVIQAALTHPEMVEALGHNVPRVFMLVFGSGCALAGLAGVIGGMTFVTEPRWRAVGSIMFVVVVVGGMGSLAGAFVGSLLIGLLQTLPLTVDRSLADAARRSAGTVGRRRAAIRCCSSTLAQVAPILPYLLLVLMLIFGRKGCSGRAKSEAAHRATTPSSTSAVERRRWLVWGSYALVLLVAPLSVHEQPRADDALADRHRDHRLPAYNILLGQGGMLSFGHAVYSGLGAFLAIHALNLRPRGTLHWPVSLSRSSAGSRALLRGAAGLS